MEEIEEQRAKIAKTVADLPGGIGHGRGDADRCCTIAAVSLAMTGKVSDGPIPCVSEVIRIWVIKVQDNIPVEMLNSPEWKELIPLIAGTGQEREAKRAEVALDWMWGTVLPRLQGVADEGGYGKTWRAMCEKRTVTSDFAANTTAHEAHEAYAANAAHAAARDADTAAYAADTAAYAADTADAADFWRAVDPASALRRMIAA